MQHHLIKTGMLAGIMLALSCSAQAADNVVVIPLFSASGDATAADVLAGKTFSNATANGLSGTRSPAPVAATGQTVGDPIATTPGSDGDEAKGISVSTRFTDNGDGTVTDNLTGLVWLQDADCVSLGSTNGTDSQGTWADALADSNSLADGMCGLTDSSSAGDWRLPNLFELESLRDMSEHQPALPASHQFNNVIGDAAPEAGLFYWTSTSVDDTTTNDNKAWIVEFTHGIIAYLAKTDTDKYIWPVRDAQ